MYGKVDGDVIKELVFSAGESSVMFDRRLVIVVW